MNISRGFFLLLIIVLLAFSAAMVVPFLQYFLLSILLAYIFMPIQHRLEKRSGPKLAAGSIVFVSVVLIIVPLLYVLRTAVLESMNLIAAIRSGEITLAEPEAQIRELTGVDIDLSNQIQSAVEGLQLGNFLTVVDTLVHLLIGLGLTVFLLYYFLKDGDKFMRWLRSTVPLPGDVLDRIFVRGDQIMKAVLVGHIFVAVVQGVLAGIGLFVTGIPNAVLWTVIMVVLSLLPIVGSFLVWGPAAVFLFLRGEFVLSGFLVLWGAVVVGISDDYLRPVIVDRYAEVNPSVIIIGVLGGIYVFGVMGIFYGPVIIGLLRATLDVFREELDDDRNLTLGR
jgi:predicted PurR-regulated permease PerM